MDTIKEMTIEQFIANPQSATTDDLRGLRESGYLWCRFASECDDGGDDDEYWSESPDWGWGERVGTRGRFSRDDNRHIQRLLDAS